MICRSMYKKCIRNLDREGITDVCVCIELTTFSYLDQVLFSKIMLSTVTDFATYSLFPFNSNLFIYNLRIWITFFTFGIFREDHSVNNKHTHWFYFTSLFFFMYMSIGQLFLQLTNRLFWLIIWPINQSIS